MVDRATGQPARFIRTLPANSNESWFRYTTLGDGLAGNYVSVSPYATAPYAIRSNAAQTLQGNGALATPVAPIVPNTVTVSASPVDRGIFEFDLSSVLRLREDLLATSSLEIDYTSTAFNSPAAFANNPDQRAVLGNTLYFRTSSQGFPGVIWQTDGTASGTRRVGGAGEFFSTDNYRKVGDHLYYIAGGSLWVIDGEGLVPRSLANGFTNLGEVVEIDNRVLFSSNGNLYSMITGQAPTIILSSGQPVTGVSHLMRFDLGTAIDQANLFFFRNGINASRLLSRVDAATGQVFDVLSDLYDEEEIVSIGGANGSAMYFTARDNQADSARSMWRVTRTGSVTANSSVTGLAPIGSPQLLRDLGGTLVFSQGNVVRAIYFGGTQAIQVIDFNSNSVALFDATIANFTVVDFGQGPRLVFSANLAVSSTSQPYGNEIWISDGTTAGTALLADVNQQASGRDTLSSAPNQFSVVGNKLYFTAYQGSAVTNRELWQTDGTRAGTVLLKEFQAGTPGGLSNVDAFLVGGATRLFARADDGSGLKFWSGDSSGILRIDQNLGLTLTVETLFDEGDFVLDSRDATSVARFQFQTLVTAPSGIHQVALFDGVQDAVREALRTGKTRLTVRLSTTSPNVDLNVQQSLAEKIFGSLPGGPGKTRLVVTPSPGVLIDVFNDFGDQLATGKALVDTRNFDAGTYYVRAYTPTPLSTNLPFTIEIGAPPAGQTRPQYSNPDRDVIHGGDGNDTLAGNSDIDRLFGGSGRDLFVADVLYLDSTVPTRQSVLSGVEPRDWNATDDYPLANVPPAESMAIVKNAQLDPIIDLPDPALRRKLAEVLNIATTDAYTSLLSPLLARPLHGSDLASLVELDLGYTTFNNLTGLERAINLRALNLSGTEPGSIGELGLATSTSTLDAGAPLGPSRLEYLSFDAAYIDFLEPLTLLHELKGLSLDGFNTSIGVTSFAPLVDLKKLNFLSADGLSFIVPLDPLAKLTELRTLSLKGSMVEDISPLSALNKLERVYLDDNKIARIDSLAGQWYSDDSLVSKNTTVNTKFSATGNWHSSIQNAQGTANGGYRFHAPVPNETAIAQWQFGGLQPGEYEVWVTWPAFDDRASNAQFAIENATQFVNGSAVITKTTTQVDQRLAPSGQNLGSIKWQRLGSVPVIVAPGAVNTSGFLNVSLQDVPGANAANGVIVADSVRLVRIGYSNPLELLTLNRNPLGNDAHTLISSVFEPAIGDPTGLTPWVELQYTPNLSAPSIARSSPVLVVKGETTSVATIPGYTPPSGSDPDGGSVTFGYESASDVNSGSRYFSGDDAVVLPNTLQQSNSTEFAFEFWFSTTKTASQTLLSAVNSIGTNSLRIGTQHTAGASISNVVLQLGLNSYSIPAFGSLTDGKQHHLYVGLNNLGNVSAAATVYVDGFSIGTTTISAAVFALDSVVLGQAQTAVRGGYIAANAFVGTLDELRIWSNPRTPAQITGDRSLRLTSYEPFLRADYTFDDDAASTTAIDNARDSARPASILGWWRAEGNARDVITGVAAEPRNGATYDVGVNSSRQAFSLDGVDDYVNVLNNAGQNPTGQITLEAWINPTEAKLEIIVGKASGYQIYLGADRKVNFFLPGVGSLVSLTTVPLNQWTHVAATFFSFINGFRAIYINGVLNNSASGAGTITVVNNPLQIGAFNVVGNNGGYFKGRIDEVGVYGQALILSQIADIYVNGVSHHGTYGDTIGGAGNTSAPPDRVAGLTSIQGDGVIVGGNAASTTIRPLGGSDGLRKLQVTSIDGGVGFGSGRTTTTVQDVYVGLFTGIYGSKFDDLDGNGSRSISEPGIEGWPIYLDTNGDTIVDQTTLTDRNGDFSFINLPWSATPASIWQATSPAWFQTVSQFTGIAVNGQTHLVRYDFGGRHQVRIVVTSDGTTPLILPADEGQTVQLSAATNASLLTPQFVWTVVGATGQPLAFSNPGNVNAATFTPLDQGDFIVTIVVSSAIGDLLPYSFTETKRIVARNLAPVINSASLPATWTEGDDLAIQVTAVDIDSLDYILEFDVDSDGVFSGSADRSFTKTGSLLIPWSEIVAAGLGDGPRIYSVRIRVRDNGGGVASLPPMQLVLNNTAPFASAGGPYTITEGGSLQLVAIASDAAGASDPLTFAWDLDNDGQFDDATGASPLLTWPQLVALGLGNGPTSYPIRLRVSDDNGGVTLAAATLNVTNLAPTILSLSSESTVEEGVPVVVVATIADPSATDTLTFAWSVTKNGVPYATGSEPTLNFTPNDQGNYVVILIVTDSDGANDSKSITIKATNVAPRATINLPTPPREGVNTIRFTTLLDGPSDLAAGLLFSIDIGDDGLFEVVDSNLSNVDIVLLDQGTYALRLRVKDKDGATRDYSRTIVAENAPPIATFELSSPGTILEGASGLSVRFVGASDPSLADAAAGFTYSYDLDGDGVFEFVNTLASSKPISFPQEGNYTIRGRINDRDGGYSEYALQVAVQNVAPQILAFTGAASGNEGSSIAFTGSAADPGADVLTARALIRRTNVANDPGIEIPVVIAADRNFRFDPIFDTDIVGGYDVLLMINDGTVSSQQSRHVTINNVTPTIDTQYNATIVAGRSLTRKLSFVDPGKDVWIVKADFGQGLAPIPFNSIKKNFVLDHAFATPGTFTVRAEVFDGIATTLSSFQVEVMPNSAPTVLHPISDKTVTQGTESVSTYVDLTQVFVDSDGPVTELTYTIASNSNAALVATSIATGQLTLSVSPGSIGTATITVRATDFGGLSVSDSFNVTVQATQSLQVRSVSPTNTGVQIEVDTIPDLSVLNVFDGVDASLDLADVALIGANSGAVRGSLLWNASTNKFEFVKTGGPLVADNYTLTLFSRVDGWKTAAGALLDGDNNGIPGGDLVRAFTVAPTTARIVSIPDFSRGATVSAGQSVNLSFDNGNPGVPVTISDGAGVLAVDFDVVYNPSLISFSSTYFGVLPSGWSSSVNLISTGRMRLSLSGTTPLAAGPQIITRLLANIPANAPYGASDLVRVENLAVYTQSGGNVPVPSIGDAGLHKAVFVGDTNGDGLYTAQDAGWNAGVVVGAYTGFDAHSWTDPSIVADVNKNGALDGLDSSWIARKGLSPTLQPEIPNLPAGSIAVQSGVDPTIAAGVRVLARPGQTVQVPIRITDSATGLWGVDTFVSYNTNLLDAVDGLNSGNVALAGMFLAESGWSLDSFTDDATGTVRIAAYRATPSAATQGPFAQVAFTVKPGTPTGEIPLAVSGYANVPPFSFSFVSGSILVDADRPTVAFTPVSPSPRTTPVTSVNMVFSEPVVGLDLVDIALTRNGTAIALTGASLATSDGGTAWVLTMPAALTNLAGGYNLAVIGSGLTDVAGNTMAANTSVNWFRKSFAPANGLRISYADSVFDTDVGIGPGDDTATDTVKTPLLPGGTATTVNYTNYSRGINAVVVDLDGLPGSLTVSDFEFRIGNSNTPDSWALAPSPSAPIVRIGAGIGGSNRVTINWAANVIQKTWLQVSVKANLNTGLIDPMVFYWGNAIGDINNSTTDVIVNATDIAGVVGNQNSFLNPAPLTSRFDFNHDRQINATDIAIAVGNQTSFLSALRLITVPAAGGGGGEGEKSSGAAAEALFQLSAPAVMIGVPSAKPALSEVHQEEPQRADRPRAKQPMDDWYRSPQPRPESFVLDEAITSIVGECEDDLKSSIDEIMADLDFSGGFTL